MRVTTDGLILSDSFGRVPDTEYVYGDLADIGWKVRFSCTRDRLGTGIADTLEGGHDVPVTVTGNLEATMQRTDAVLKLKALSVVQRASANGKVPESAKS